MSELAPSPIIQNEALLESHLKRHPEFQLAAVCSCGKTMPATKIASHIGGAHHSKYIKRGWRPKHRVVGYTLMDREES